MELSGLVTSNGMAVRVTRRVWQRSCRSYTSVPPSPQHRERSGCLAHTWFAGENAQVNLPEASGADGPVGLPAFRQLGRDIGIVGLYCYATSAPVGPVGPVFLQEFPFSILAPSLLVRRPARSLTARARYYVMLCLARTEPIGPSGPLQARKGVASCRRSPPVARRTNARWSLPLHHLLHHPSPETLLFAGK